MKGVAGAAWHLAKIVARLWRDHPVEMFGVTWRRVLLGRAAAADYIDRVNLNRRLEAAAVTVLENDRLREALLEAHVAGRQPAAIADGPGEGFVPGMRDTYPGLCWRYVDGGTRVCIRDRGHDDGEHEDVTGLDPGIPSTGQEYRRRDAAAGVDELEVRRRRR